MFKKFSKKTLGLAILLTGVVTLSSCNNSNNEQVGPSESVQEFLDFSKNFRFTIDPGEDGIKVDLNQEILSSSDDLIYITEYIGNEQEVVVPKTVRDIKVVGIQDRGFSNKNVTKITLPDTIETITGKSFNNISSLTSMNLPEQTTVSPSSFDGTKYLIDTYVKESSTQPGLFIVNSGLYSVDKDLKGDINIPDFITSIPDNIFKDKAITNVQFNNKVETIGDSAFENTSLTTVTIPESVTKIGSKAFANNDHLTKFYAFDINDKDLEYKQVSYGQNIIADCPNLIEVAFSGEKTLKDITASNKLKDSVFYDSKIQKVYLNGETIVEKCLMNFSSIQEVHLMNSVIATKNEAFSNLPNLSTFTPNKYDPSSNLSYISYDVANPDDEIIQFVETKAYKDATSSIVDDYVIFGSGIIEVRGNANFSKLSGKTIKGYPNNIFKNNQEISQSFLNSIGFNSASYIGESAFENTKISTIDLTRNGYFIARNAFANCKDLTEVKVSDDTQISDDAFKGSYGIKTMEGNINKSLASMIGKADNENQYALESVVLSDNILDIVKEQFKDAKKLKSIKYSPKLKSIGIRAFFNCSSLTSFTIPYSTTLVDASAFGLCTSLKDLIIVDAHVSGTNSDEYNDENSVKPVAGIPNRIAFGDAVFYGCTSLPEKFVIPFRIKSFGGVMFTNSSVKHIEVRLTDYDRRFNNNLENFNPVTDSVASIVIQPGFNQKFEIGDDKNPITIDTTVKGLGIHFTGENIN